MKLCTIYATTLRVHPLFPLLCLPFLLTGQGEMLLAYGAALALHEAGHVGAAVRLRLPVSEIELTPFGGAMQIPLSDGLRGWPAFLLSSAGILSNLLFALLSLATLRYTVSSFLSYFLMAHCMMLAVNLIPALPLDGGRMLLALLSLRFRREKVFRVLLIMGRSLAVILMVYSLWQALQGLYHPNGLFLGCFLLYASALEEKHGAARYLSALFSRRFKIDTGEALPVQHLCASSDMPLYTLLPQLNPGAYHRVLLMDDAACDVLGVLEEEDLYRAVLDTPNATLGRLLTQNLQK